MFNTAGFSRKKLLFFLLCILTSGLRIVFEINEQGGKQILERFGKWSMCIYVLPKTATR